MRHRLASILHWLTGKALSLAYVDQQEELPVVNFDHDRPGFTHITLDLEGNHVEATWRTPEHKEQ